MENIIWKLETDEGISDDLEAIDLGHIIDQIRAGELGHIILRPDQAINECNFIQVMLGSEGLLHVELSKKFEFGKGSILYFKDGFSRNDAEEILLNFLNKGEVPQAEDWDIVGRFD